jgi:hypothetical protein
MSVGSSTLLMLYRCPVNTVTPLGFTTKRVSA